MAIKLTTNLDIRTSLPVDTRFVLTKARMVAMDDDLMPSQYFAICSEDSKLYIYTKTNTPDPTTGKFRVYESGGSGGTDTKYRIVSNGTNKWKLQKSTDGISWVDAEGSIDISGTISAIENQILAEATARETKDTELETAISEETVARTEADAYLQGEIDSIPRAADYTIIEKAPGTGYTAAYRLTKDGAEVGAQINIPSPSVIKKAEVRVCTGTDDPAYIEGGIPVGDKCIDFTWSNDTHSYINVKDLVSTYTAGAGITINSSNEISVKTDDNSIITTTSDGKLSIKGYENANQGQMLVKDETVGLTWVDPLSPQELHEAVAQATAQATIAGQEATKAGNSAVAADTSAQTAERINQQTMNWVNNKFWWGTLEEYNALEEINEGTFYFIQL